MKRILSSKTLLIAGLIYAMTLLAGSLIKINSGATPKIGNLDKIVHFTAYFGLTVIWQLFFFVRFKRENMRPSLRICIFAIIFGIVVEVLQKELTTYRSFESLDILANTVGVLLAFGFLYWLSSKSFFKNLIKPEKKKL